MSLKVITRLYLRSLPLVKPERKKGKRSSFSCQDAGGGTPEASYRTETDVLSLSSRLLDRLLQSGVAVSIMATHTDTDPMELLHQPESPPDRRRSRGTMCCDLGGSVDLRQSSLPS
ncbi:hypothetical protein HRR83_001701 [Exophiala dermatitidis]|uniref:Uncharacterized protein n=1 Tax=Exophiala dermatitidis TaxID=5970 RepID=A0AAN6F0J6_EXODE|nr:hypothetical protein HRR73_004835 [Exophiala dermatitidis]KAJ4526507.1 hypothetical protein HRR74_001705 [Exophiala dermatitidis]KAJ4532246.1 hypothetical protein HRR76_007245 [Exophiala dermatitidis]KAJ4546282.1 hypothetical protein HRR77_004818 [Exophiala dermatitidis]KAJ4567475.1 hypothetical protein HRR79_004989 [Exophiala dermatitidis]